MSRRFIVFLTASALCVGIALVADIPSASARLPTGPITSQVLTNVDTLTGVESCAPAVTVTGTLPIRLSLPLIMSPGAVNPPPVPNFSHVYVLVMENKDYNFIIGNPDYPYLNCLANTFGLATKYSAITHPSQPNYLALFSGSTQTVTDDSTINLTGLNIADQIEAKGKTWKVFAENYPLNCSLASSATGGDDDPTGQYARKENPAISFTDISGSPTRCANITNFSHFDPAAADYELIIPNLCNNTHDFTGCSQTGDAFLKGFVPKILNSSAWAQRGVLFIVYDEGEVVGPGLHVVAAVISNFGQRGITSSTAHDHYSLIRTVEDAWGLGCLNNSCSANSLAEFFH